VFNFRTVYQQFLEVMSTTSTGSHEESLALMRQMCEPALYTELAEYREEQIMLNDVKVAVENHDSKQFEMYLGEVKFVAGKHIDRQRNVKELIGKYKGEYAKVYDKEV
jgi:hypothetical protein